MKYKFAAKKELPQNDGWCFALVNSHLVEIYFRGRKEMYGHCFARKKEYSKTEQRMIDADLKRYAFTYRKRVYFDQKRGIKHKAYDFAVEIKGPFYTWDEQARKFRKQK